MDEKDFSDKQVDLSAFEERYVLWQQSYRQHLNVMQEYTQWREGFLQELRRERQSLQELRNDLRRFMQEQVERRSNY